MIECSLKLQIETLDVFSAAAAREHFEDGFERADKNLLRSDETYSPDVINLNIHHLSSLSDLID